MGKHFALPRVGSRHPRGALDWKWTDETVVEWGWTRPTPRLLLAGSHPLH